MKPIHNILFTSGRPWAVHPAGQQPIYFNYNSVGDNTRVYSSVANDWERDYTYDWLGRKLTYAEGELAEILTYNGSNLSTHTQSWSENGLPQSRTTQYHYNAHRLDSVSYDDALTTIYHYNAAGQTDSIYDESGVVCYQYGNMGEITKETRIYALPFLLQQIALTTQFRYDSWGRVDSIFYPDGERLKYQYDLGGQLKSITNNSNYTYLDNVTYDKFGAKVSQEYGNGMVTSYTYDSYTRRLSQITVADNSNNPYGDIQYGYDPVGNVTQANSTCPWLPNHTFSETFTYDASDQLTSATESQSQSYQLAVTYGNWGKITSYSLAQTDLQNNTTQSETQAYTYPATNSIGSSQTLFAPVSRTIQGGQHPHSVQNFTFGINGSLRKREIQFPVSSQNTEYYLFNSAANLKAYSNNGLDFAYYGYNASNTRAYKLSMQNMGQWVNGQPQPIHLQIQQAMFYPNAYLNFNQNGEYTKHYYNGSERIASRLGTVTLNNATTSNARLTTRSGQLEDRFRNDIRTLVYAGDIPMDMPPEPVSATSLQQTGTASDIFYYHTNHLGSTAYVTDQNQTVTQGFLYAPFGEITTEYNANFGSDVLPKYSFNAKELDEETGMYYYEARYYKPPVFTSRDPMFEKYFWMTPYAYCANNPVKYVDPDGRKIWIVGGEGNEIEYTPGMAVPEGASEFVSNSINILNAMNSTENGSVVLGDLVRSNNNFSITNNQTSVEGTACFIENKNGGGTLNMAECSLLSYSHELFHAYQHENGQGGKSIFNEVEAYLFSDAIYTQYLINANKIGAGGSVLISRNYGTSNSESFNNSTNTLIYGQKFSNEDFNTVVDLFKSESGANIYGIYNDYPLRRSNQTKNLIERFYPLIR